MMPESEATSPVAHDGTRTVNETFDKASVAGLRHVSKHFGGAHDLVDASLHVGKREVVALVGSNGADKSTIMRITSGIHTADTGEILVAGRRVRFHGPQDAREPLPGLLDAPSIWKENETFTPPESQQAAIAALPLGRAGYPEDVAAAVTWLCSPGAAWTPGEIININGGQYFL